MTTHMTGTREEWLSARLALLEEEKELTRRSDELARRRQELQPGSADASRMVRLHSADRARLGLQAVECEGLGEPSRCIVALCCSGSAGSR